MHPCHLGDKIPEKTNLKEKRSILVPGFRRVTCSLGFVVSVPGENQGVVTGECGYETELLTLCVCAYSRLCV